MGSPEVALPPLEALLTSSHQVVGVVAQPDRPAGRGQSMAPCAVAATAREKGLTLLQPASLQNNPEFLEALKKLRPDIIAIVAYGKILPREILKLPPKRCLNVHFSLLPQYRGAAPVQWALIHDEPETGVTTFFLVEKVDAGPILLKKKIPIQPEDNAETLGHRLAIAGAALLVETLDRFYAGDLLEIPQEDHLATFAPLLKKQDGRIDWTQKASAIRNQIRGMTPWPGAFTTLDGKIFKILSAENIAAKKTASPGEVINERMEIACSDGLLLPKEVQLEGKKRMSVFEFLKGYPVKIGTHLGESA